MKLFCVSIITAAFLAGLPKQSTALKCGSGVTEPCIGDTDVRYNPDVTYNLKDQADFWSDLEGLYIQDQCDYDADGTKRTKFFLPGLAEEAGLGSFDFCNMKAFLNITIDGSRYHYHRTLLIKHNNDGILVPGLPLPGLVFPTDAYGVATFEKNGEAKIFMSSLGYSNLTAQEPPTTLTPVAGKALLGLTNQDGGDIYESVYCPTAECTKMNTYIENYGNIGDTTGTGANEVSSFGRSSGIKVDKETWMQEWSKAYTDFRIPPPDEPFTAIPGLNLTIGFIQPFDPVTSDVAPKCMTLVCPTEDDWKKMDPVLGTSPYIEPNGVLTGGFIAGITIASIVVAVLIFYVIYKRGVDAREKRVKEAVLKSIAQSMSLSTSQSLKPKDLEEMFAKIDADGNGSLDKDEVKKLVDEAGVANMSERDYDILFASIDLDNNGTLDFAEFCAFFTSISVAESGKDDFDEA